MHLVGKNVALWSDKSDGTYSNNFSLNGLTNLYLRPCNKLW